MRKVLPSQVIAGGRSVTVCASEYSCVIANAMFSVPSVTMNGGSLMRVTSRPLTRPNSAVTPMPAGDRERRRHAEVGGELGHHDAAERHHHAARQVDAGGEDHQRLADRDDADHHHLLQDQRQVAAGEEAVALRGEERAGDQQRDERAERADRRQVPAGVCGRWTRPPPRRRRASVGGASQRFSRVADYFLPQHSSVPVFTSLLSTPGTGLSAISVTPVSV